MPGSADPARRPSPPCSESSYCERVTPSRTASQGAELARLGFAVTPSQANFVWCRRQDRPVKTVFEELKKRNILVRYMAYDGYGDGLRVSVGTDAEVDRLLRELEAILS